MHRDVWVRPSCVANSFTLGITGKLFNCFFHPALFIGTVDFYQFIPLSLTLTMSGGHKVFLTYLIYLVVWLTVGAPL